MNSEMYLHRLEELDIVFEDGDRSARYPKANQFLTLGNHPFINTTNISDSQLDFSDVNFISDTKFAEIKKGRVEVGDILISTRGSKLGKAAYYESHRWLQPLINAQLLIIRCKDKRIHSKFLWYILTSVDGQAQIESLKSGSAQPQLPVRDLKKFEVSFPSYLKQIQIVNTLDALNNKITINRQINQTLEQMAQAIFKSWYVDFDPVRAKMEGRDTGLPAHIADLFPDELEKSVLGMKPRGWVVSTLEKKLLPKKGKNITLKTITPGEVPVVAGGLTPAYYHDTHNVTGPVITISASGANAGYVKLYHQDIWASDCSFVNKEETDNVFSIYLFFKYRQDEITKMQQGAAQPHVYPKDLARLLLVDPPSELWQKLEEIIRPLFGNIKNNTEELIILEKLRELLLPKLLSGELETEKDDTMVRGHA